MVLISWRTEPKVPRLMACWVIMPNQVSIWLSQELPVGVKWKVTLTIYRPTERLAKRAGMSMISVWMGRARVEICYRVVTAAVQTKRVCDRSKIYLMKGRCSLSGENAGC
jgi:hypothetical protein